MIKTETDTLNIKYKPVDSHKIILSADRLTRFKDTEEKYLRVFKDILINNLISPKFKKSELDNMDYELITRLAAHIINESLSTLTDENTTNDLLINKKLKDYECSVFEVNKNTELLLNNNINYKKIISLLPEYCTLNLKWLKELANSDNANITSLKKGYRFPIKKVLICEGLTEEILLPVFGKFLDYDFDCNGIQIISAGGKNQVVKMYYEYADKLRLPIFILLDGDAKSNCDEILPKLRVTDKIYMIKRGEFEDLLPAKLIEKTLKYSIENISDLPEENYKETDSAVQYLEEFYKKRGTHEFKKAEFAQIVKENISDKNDISDEVICIINEIKNL